MNGTTFELNSDDNVDVDVEDEIGEFWTNVSEDDPDIYKNPCSSNFNELKIRMVEVTEGVFKKVQKKAPVDAKDVDLQRTRVYYHRNLYLENADHPFDSTYLNGNKPDEICIPLKRTKVLAGFMEAIGSMKEGEQSLFVVTYKKMFGELGCPIRVSY